MKKLPRPWAPTSRRAFTLGMGGAIVAGCLPGPGSGAPEGVSGTFASLSYAASEGGTPFLLLSPPSGAGPSDRNVQEVLTPSEVHWVGPAESLLTLKAQGPELSLAVSGPFDQTQIVNREEFWGGRLHQRIRSEFGEGVLVDVFQAWEAAGSEQRHDQSQSGASGSAR